MDKLICFGFVIIVILLIVITYKPTCYDIYDYAKENFEDAPFNEVNLNIEEISLDDTKVIVSDAGVSFTHEGGNTEIIGDNKVEFINGKLNVTGKHSVLFSNNLGQSTIIELEDNDIYDIGDFIASHEELFVMYSDVDTKRYIKLYNEEETNNRCVDALNETYGKVEDWMVDYCY